MAEVQIVWESRTIIGIRSQGSNVEDLQQGGDAAEYLTQYNIMEFNASAVRHSSFMTP